MCHLKRVTKKRDVSKFLGRDIITGCTSLKPRLTAAGYRTPAPMLLTAEIYRTVGGLRFEEKKKFFFLGPRASAADPGLEQHENYIGSIFGCRSSMASPRPETPPLDGLARGRGPKRVVFPFAQHRSSHRFGAFFKGWRAPRAGFQLCRARV